jgi:hypothetical protein
LLQLFGRRVRTAPSAPVERFFEWTTKGRVQAVQLELGMPLRWPGRQREQFLAAARGAFSPESAPSRLRVTLRPSTTHSPVAPIALQFYDCYSGIGLLSTVSVTKNGTLNSRLLLLDGRGVAIFLGEDPDGSGTEHDGPRFSRNGDELKLAFDGWLLGLDDPRLYVDVEHAFAASRIVRGRVEISMRPLGSPRYGQIAGRVEIGGHEKEIRAFGFADVSLMRPAEVNRSDVSLSASFGEEGAYLIRAGSAGYRATRITANGEEQLGLRAVRVDLAADRSTPRRFAIEIDGELRLRAEPLGRVVIHRPQPGGRTARTTFGVVRVDAGNGATGYGFYDYSCIVRRG